MRQRVFFILFSIVSLVGYGFFVFAAPPGPGGYNPGETLDPECIPGQLVPEPCIVQLPSGGSSGWSLSGNTVPGGVSASIDTVFNGVGLNDITMTGPYTGTTTQTWVIVITATGTPDQMEVIIDGDSEYVGDVFPSGPLPVDDGLTLNFGSDTGHTIGDSWEFTMTPASGGTTAFLGTLNNEDLIFKTNNIERMRLLSNGDISLVQYQSFRDDSGTYSPSNFLYTDSNGNLMSAPTSLLGGGSFSLTSQDEGSTLTTTTNTFNFTGAGVTATDSGGGVVTVDISGGGGGADGNIYDNDGTLAATRTLDANNNNLSFTNLGIFSALTQNGNTYLGLFDNITGIGYGGYALSTRQLIGGIEHVTNFGSDISGFGFDWDDLNAGIIDTNGTTNNGTAIEVQADNGLRFRFSNAGVFDEYTFPRTDGTANQVLTTDGLGQLSWTTVSGGGSDTSIYTDNGALTGNRTVDADGNNLTFSNLDQLLLSTQSGITGMVMSDKGSGYGVVLFQGQELISGEEHRSQISTDIGDGNYDADFDDLRLGLVDTSTDDNGAAIEVNATTGIRFRFRNTGVMSNYFFPRTDGTINQVLSTDGVGQLSWTTLAGSPITIGTSGNTLYSSGLTGTGQGNTSFGNNIFLGVSAGSTTNAAYANFFGYQAGMLATNASYSNLFGYRSGKNATNAEQSNFFGPNAGYEATNASNSNFFGNSAGYQAISASNSNFLGSGAGFVATNAAKSNFFGTGAGAFATNAANSNFMGDGAGGGATNAASSNFFGASAGNAATGASGSNFFGYSAGQGATGASGSNFFGESAGQSATGASNSFFAGTSAGTSATNASFSIFIGAHAGYFSANSSNSIFLGDHAGYSGLVDNTTDPDDYSILLGTYTSAGGFSNSIALGQRAINTASNQFMIGSATRPINTLILTGASGNTCTLDVTVASPSCSSDERLKTNVTELENTLEKLIQVRTVNYNWINFPDAGSQIGFLAQDLEQYFPEVVSDAPNGFKTVSYGGMTPILVEAIREMNLNVTQIADMTRDNTWRDSLISWLGNASNKITRIFTGELCLYDENGQTECINASELRALKQSQNIQTTPEVAPPTVDTPLEDTPPPTDESPTEEPSTDEPSIEEPPAVEPSPEVPPPTVDTPTVDTPPETGTE